MPPGWSGRIGRRPCNAAGLATYRRAMRAGAQAAEIRERLTKVCLAPEPPGLGW